MFRRRTVPRFGTVVPKRKVVVSLQDECLWYIIVNIQQFSPEALSLLPQAMRYKLLLNLPVVDVCQLESTCVMKGIDTETLWESLCAHRLPISLASVPSLPCGVEGFSWKEIYFNAVLRSLFHDPIVGCCFGYSMLAESMYNEFVDMLFSIPQPLGLDLTSGLLLTESNYHFPGLVPRVLRLDADMLNLFEGCHFCPRYLCIPTATRTNLDLKCLQANNARLAHFMSNVQVLELTETDTYFRRGRHSKERKEEVRNFIEVMRLFLGSVTVNSQNVLYSLHLDLSRAESCIDSHNLTDDIVPALTIDLQKQLKCLQYVSIKAPVDVDLGKSGGKVRSFFDAVSSLPQLSTLELGLGLTPQHVKLIVSSWKHFCEGSLEI